MNISWSLAWGNTASAIEVGEEGGCFHDQSRAYAVQSATLRRSFSHSRRWARRNSGYTSTPYPELRAVFPTSEAVKQGCTRTGYREQRYYLLGTYVSIARRLGADLPAETDHKASTPSRTREAVSVFSPPSRGTCTKVKTWMQNFLISPPVRGQIYVRSTDQSNQDSVPKRQCARARLMIRPVGVPAAAERNPPPLRITSLLHFPSHSDPEDIAGSLAFRLLIRSKVYNEQTCSYAFPQWILQLGKQH